MLKVVVVGDIGIDYYQNLNLLKPGGIAFNFAYNFLKNGVKKVSLVSVLGNDISGTKLISIIKKLGINTAHIQNLKGETPIQNIRLLKGGERKFTGYKAGVLKKWKLSSKDIDFIKKQDIIFVPLSDGMENIFKSISNIDSRVFKICDFSQDYDKADFDKETNVVTKNCKYFNIIFIGGKNKHKKMIEKLSKKYPEKVFVLTLGKNGSYTFFEGISYKEPAKISKKVIDTTGAGDAFQANFIGKFLISRDIKKSQIYATKAASLVVQHIGSTKVDII